MSYNNQTGVTLTANGTYNSASTPAINAGSGLPMAYFCEGTFDGATVKLQHKITSLNDGSSPAYVDVGAHTTLTANGGAIFISPFSDLAVNVANDGTSTSVRVIIKPIEL